MKLMQRQIALVVMLCLILTPLASGQCGEKKTNGKLSPDGTMILYAGYDEGQEVRDIEIYTARLDGSHRRKLTDNKSMDGFPNWSPDGKQIAFISDRSGHDQVYVMDVDGTNVRQLTKEEQGVGNILKCGPDGRVACIALRKRHLRLKLYDLIITDGNVSKTVAERVRITDFAWHPDGTSIVYGGVGEIVFHDLITETKSRVQLTEVDQRFESHGVRSIEWQPDHESINCRIEFWGARLQSPNGVRNKIFGDDELFTVTLAGKVTWSTAEE